MGSSICLVRGGMVGKMFTNFGNGQNGTVVIKDNYLNKMFTNFGNGQNGTEFCRQLTGLSSGRSLD